MIKVEVGPVWPAGLIATIAILLRPSVRLTAERHLLSAKDWAVRPLTSTLASLSTKPLIVSELELVNHGSVGG